jgi:CRISPR/Cas system CSM-associated protein Csm2 small subunit
MRPVLSELMITNERLQEQLDLQAVQLRIIQEDHIEKMRESQEQQTVQMNKMQVTLAKAITRIKKLENGKCFSKYLV